MRSVSGDIPDIKGASGNILDRAARQALSLTRLASIAAKKAPPEREGRSGQAWVPPHAQGVAKKGPRPRVRGEPADTQGGSVKSMACRPEPAVRSAVGKCPHDESRNNPMEGGCGDCCARWDVPGISLPPGETGRPARVTEGGTFPNAIKEAV